MGLWTCNQLSSTKLSKLPQTSYIIPTDHNFYHSIYKKHVYTALACTRKYEFCRTNQFKWILQLSLTCNFKIQVFVCFVGSQIHRQCMVWLCLMKVSKVFDKRHIDLQIFRFSCEILKCIVVSIIPQKPPASLDQYCEIVYRADTHRVVVLYRVWYIH